jgi:hypothetical protein
VPAASRSGLAVAASPAELVATLQRSSAADQPGGC